MSSLKKIDSVAIYYRVLCFYQWCHQESNDSDNTQYIKILYACLRKSPTHFSSPLCTALLDSTLLVQLLRKGSKILHITEAMRRTLFGIQH